MGCIEKVAVIGLDCADPILTFDRFIDELPVIRRLAESGTFGQLESCVPPITVPAWSCMAASQDPGTLGVYGFRNRADYSYEGLSIATSLSVRQPRLWDILGQRGRSVIVLGVPQTYPIVRPINGCMVTSFLTPSTESQYTYPPSLRQEIAEVVGDYVIDVEGFRTDDKGWLLKQIYQMTDKRFRLARHLVSSREWALFWMVEMGHDRMHHGFWQFMDREHHRYREGNEYESAIRDYYRHVDRTAIWIVSDHGAKRMDGGICLNDWLMEQGYLRLKQPISGPTRFSFEMVDWSRTVAWGEGGYYGRCFLNVAGREPQGQVPASQYEAVRDELIAKIEAVPDHRGRPMGTRVYKPQGLYRQVNGVPPDLMVLFGDLHWRSVGRVGNAGLHTFENDTGPDDANHAMMGMYLYAHRSLRGQGRLDGARLYDVAPTILAMLGEPIPQWMCGRNLLEELPVGPVGEPA
ncbi:MAG: alkaline phosphatase family protein [Phycisphaerae bacterium]